MQAVREEEKQTVEEKRVAVVKAKSDDTAVRLKHAELKTQTLADEASKNEMELKDTIARNQMRTKKIEAMEKNADDLVTANQMGLFAHVLWL